MVKRLTHQWAVTRINGLRLRAESRADSLTCTAAHDAAHWPQGSLPVLECPPASHRDVALRHALRRPEPGPGAGQAYWPLGRYTAA